MSRYTNDDYHDGRGGGGGGGSGRSSPRTQYRNELIEQQNTHKLRKSQRLITPKVGEGEENWVDESRVTSQRRRESEEDGARSHTPQRRAVGETVGREPGPRRPISPSGGIIDSMRNRRYEQRLAERQQTTSNSGVVDDYETVGSDWQGVGAVSRRDVVLAARERRRQETSYSMPATTTAGAPVISARDRGGVSQSMDTYPARPPPPPSSVMSTTDSSRPGMRRRPSWSAKTRRSPSEWDDSNADVEHDPSAHKRFVLEQKRLQQEREDERRFAELTRASDEVAAIAAANKLRADANATAEDLEKDDPAKRAAYQAALKQQMQDRKRQKEEEDQQDRLLEQKVAAEKQRYTYLGTKGPGGGSPFRRSDGSVVTEVKALIVERERNQEETSTHAPSSPRSHYSTMSSVHSQPRVVREGRRSSRSDIPQESLSQPTEGTLLRAENARLRAELDLVTNKLYSLAAVGSLRCPDPDCGRVVRVRAIPEFSPALDVAWTWELLPG